MTSNNSNNSNKSNLNPFASLFEPDNDNNDNIINNLETIEAKPSEAKPSEAKPSARAPLRCQLERNRGKPCPYHPLNFRTNGEACPRAHNLTPRSPEERKGVICQGHFPQLGPQQQQCPFYHKPETVEMVQVVETTVPVIESKTPQKCSNEVKFGFCGFHPALYSNVSPPRGSSCLKLHERMPPCPTQRNGAQCMAENCGFFHKKAYNNNILETTQ